MSSGAVAHVHMIGPSHVLRSHYIGLNSRPNRRWIAVLVSPWLLAGCSVISGGDEAPTATSSVGAPVEVQQPLPQTLAYSDATKIGQTAAAALWQIDNGQGGEWVNNATGSSGTVEQTVAEGGTELSSACRLFNTIVTSFGGVHRYSGKICRADDGRSVVQIDAGNGGSS